MIGNMGLFGGYVWLFCGFGVGPEGNYPSQIWMSLYDEERCGWCGYLWVHDITFMVGNMIRKMRHFEGYFWLLWDSGGGTEGPGWEITSPQCG